MGKTDGAAVLREAVAHGDVTQVHIKLEYPHGVTEVTKRGAGVVAAFLAPSANTGFAIIAVGGAGFVAAINTIVAWGMGNPGAVKIV
jgi:hypothetical protein